MDYGFLECKKPKALMCYVCGRDYGTKSLGIHLKTCVKKWENEENKKPRKQRRPLPQPPPGLMEVCLKIITINFIIKLCLVNR